MKKVFNLSVILAVLMAAFTFSSCSKDEEWNIDINLDNNSKFNEGSVVTGAITSDNKIETIKIEVKEGAIWQPYETIQKGNFSGWGITENDGTYSLRIPGISAGDYTIQAIDKNGNESRKAQFTVIGTGGSGVTGDQINISSTILLGASGSSYGSFFASSTGTRYSQGQANANAATIDITYGTLTSGGPSFISPNRRSALGFTAVTGGTITYFSTTSFTAAQFNAMEDDSEFAGITASTDTQISIANGNVYFFQNAAGKKGLIYVSALTPGNTGSVTITVKVQK